MANFGYSLTKSSRIDLNNRNIEKWNRLVELEPDVLKCMACGSCTASCTAGKFTKTSLRSAILYLQNGQEKEALEYIQSCLLCGKCFMVCPRAINTRHLLLSISKIYSNR
ncbi:MAG: 4Fe-4S dicluster domain-containing protein [Bacteroidales bacterium]|nr:4Fe-4S dicluster domain-containing protein [Bacteroidales bacterium]MBP3342859.1 4Fe-4S dicluster domain-containing protein [Bacteroidales bacterium]MBQ5803362.1 4Fe-4S dicluster domain-containing protein [Bacteroidales bacterium]MBQ7997828.1 4Fe-4S dicluster domain-containing protein [Bacteroidales bacterium]MBQ8034394.1 4Fe-4S dicluster domain-containing protein [Bacteroidales bacterium]